ncbi:MAG TPA: PIN domain-containing protein [Thermoanaerobaculia bacterium]
MILVDSSAWVEYYRTTGLRDVTEAVARVIADDLCAVNGVIQVEILGYAAGSNLAQMLADFKAYNWITLTDADFDLATEMGFFLRRKGVTLPPTDLIIAASAIRTDVVLYHVDSHFDKAAQYFNLKSKNLRN